MLMVLGTKTIYLGERKSFLDRLDRALDAENAILTEVDSQAIGSHQVTTWEVRLEDGVIYLEDDTYLGKSLTGPKDLVERIASAAFGVVPPD
jgi:hypothetical protein